MKKEELENYEPKGELEGFPKEIIARMLDCQEEQGNPRDISVFEKRCDTGWGDKGFLWESAKEGYSFWNKVIRYKDFNLFFEKYPKQDNQESKTAKYVQIDNNAILSDITSTQSSVEIEINTTEDDSQDFRVGDEVIDILTKQKGKILQIDYTCTFPVYLNNGESYTLDGRYNAIDIYPKLLHYRNDYDYNVIDFNNLPKRQEPKRWRVKKEGIYYFVNFNTKDWFSYDENKDDYDHVDNGFYNSGNYFRTEVEAEIIAQKLNEYFKQLIEEEPIRAIDLPLSEMQKGMLEEQKSKKTLTCYLGNDMSN